MPFGEVDRHERSVWGFATPRVLCSPFTLFAVLAVIRQSVSNFHLSQQTGEILAALGGFNQQWAKYTDQAQTVRKRMELTLRGFDELVGVRTRALNRQVEKVEQLRMEAGLEADVLPEAEDEPLELEAGSDDLTEEGGLSSV